MHLSQTKHLFVTGTDPNACRKFRMPTNDSQKYCLPAKCIAKLYCFHAKVVHSLAARKAPSNDEQCGDRPPPVQWQLSALSFNS